VDHPERFGAFVSSVCNNVLMEMVRADLRHDRLESEMDPADDSVNLDAPLVTRQRQRQVEKVLQELPEKDRVLLRMFSSRSAINPRYASVSRSARTTCGSCSIAPNRGFGPRISSRLEPCSRPYETGWEFMSLAFRVS